VQPLRYDTLTTFGDLARDYLEIDVTCAGCGHRRTIDAASPRLRHRRIAGARFRCERCRSACQIRVGEMSGKGTCSHALC
jgi:hypothetical protein